ncbi:MAG TPA: hypothetical protein DCR02_07025 [Sphaerochaeta sp.]|nr:hypothetical protein [Sphaerochaeta sp.]
MRPVGTIRLCMVRAFWWVSPPFTITDVRIATKATLLVSTVLANNMRAESIPTKKSTKARRPMTAWFDERVNPTLSFSSA